MLVAAVVVGLALFEPRTRATFSPYMVSEGAGVRQFDYRYFGLVPYSKVVPTGGLMTEQKVADHLARAGLQVPKGLDPFHPGAATMRSYHAGSVTSTLYFTGKSGLVSHYAFFKSQAGARLMDNLEPDGTWTLRWIAPDGATTVQASGSRTYVPGTKSAAGEMLHLSVTSPTAK
jgi:hypothetical protein